MNKFLALTEHDYLFYYFLEAQGTHFFPRQHGNVLAFSMHHYCAGCSLQKKKANR